MKEVVSLSALPLSTPPDPSSAQKILLLLDRFSSAAQTAARFSSVISSERQHVISETARLRACAAAEARDVVELRGVLAREKRLVDRRSQYDALANLILDCPTLESSREELKHIVTQAERVERDTEALEETKENVSKELRLLVHCAASLDRFSKHLTTLVQELPKENAADHMDTSV